SQKSPAADATLVLSSSRGLRLTHFARTLPYRWINSTGVAPLERRGDQRPPVNSRSARRGLLPILQVKRPSENARRRAPGPRRTAALTESQQSARDDLVIRSQGTTHGRLTQVV